jgi:enoyl-CoA hydratase/carnithine racemase
MSDKLLHREDSNGIATLTLNSPNSLNALSNRMLDCLQKELDTLKEDKKIRLIIIKGAGKDFCAGHDIK